MAAKKPKAEFDPKNLDKTVVALPLLQKIHAKGGRTRSHEVIIDINLEFNGGRDAARQKVERLVSNVNGELIGSTNQYIFAHLKGSAIIEIVQQDKMRSCGTQAVEWPDRLIYRIWPDQKVQAFINKSIATVKADAAQRAFFSHGEGITWAVLDSGIDENHKHFQRHKNLAIRKPLRHRSFVDVSDSLATVDEFGHGTHVAGIIAGVGEKGCMRAVVRRRDEAKEGGLTNADVIFEEAKLDEISGMAPRCKVVSYKVLDKDGYGSIRGLLLALDDIQRVNSYGRHLLIHGINMSVGYPFEAEWFACGQSPLCVEVDRLVKSGVVVVVAAGNSGYGSIRVGRNNLAAPLALSINDPGNSDLAITVGSTHRDMPHVYGVSYFSSKGPTGDGRCKPDLLAPGEKIVSCAAGKRRADAEVGAAASRAAGTAPPTPATVGQATATAAEGAPAAATADSDVYYVEDSGTSMAAPHVSGVIAAFLSVRREFIGRPEEVKRIFLQSATDLKRDRNFQGHGLVDLMRAIQSV